MLNTDEIVDLIYTAIDDVNAKLPADQQITKDLNTEWVGVQGELDSLGCTFFTIALEQKLSEKCQKPVQIVDEQAISFENSPLQNGQVLVERIQSLVS